jgi:lipoprotein-anchoring transpeptidase ErfK/SrfK
MIRPALKTQFQLTTKRFVSYAVLVSAFTLCTNSLAAQSTKSMVRPARRIVVSFPDHKLALLEGDRVLKIYDVAVGAPASPSPTGEFQIVQRLENPTFYKPGVVVGPGPGNPLGPRWIGLNAKGFGIHGTNRSDSIGKHASHGCIRLRNSDIEDLFARVQVGDRVSLVPERNEEVARLFGGEPNSKETHEVLRTKTEIPAASYSDSRGQ